MLAVPERQEHPERGLLRTVPPALRIEGERLGKELGIAVQGVLAVGQLGVGGQGPLPEPGLGGGAAGDEPAGVVQPQGLGDHAVQVRQAGQVVEGDRAFADEVVHPDAIPT
ncbi:hypothetical protein ABIE67_004173 [Streptomyces sp. V4I8]